MAERYESRNESSILSSISKFHIIKFMTRKEFIDRFISILICRTSCSQIEVDEFRLMLELMPDKDKETLSSPTLTTSPKIGDLDWTVRPQTIRFGEQYPYPPYTTVSSGIVSTDKGSNITYSTNTDSTTYTTTSTANIDSSSKTGPNFDDIL